jgi:hypothetical protein
MMKNVGSLRVNYSLFMYDFNKNLIFSTVFRKILKYQISLKSVQWEPSCPMWTEGRTDRHEKANSLVSHFCERAYKREQNCSFRIFIF